MIIEEKMRRVRELDVYANLKARQDNGWVAMSYHHTVEAYPTPDAALDALLAKLEPDMTVEECWKKLKLSTTSPVSIGEPFSICTEKYEVSVNGYHVQANTLRDAYRKLAAHFGWEDGK